MNELDYKDRIARMVARAAKRKRGRWPKQQKDEQGRRLCRCGCGGLPVLPRRSYCSNECLERFYIRYSQGHLRNRIKERDKEICFDCGSDLAMLKRFLGYWETLGCAKRPCRDLVSAGMKRRGFKRGGSLWDAHHVIKWVDGGDVLGLDNVITLCEPCHKKRHANRKNESKQMVLI